MLHLEIEVGKPFWIGGEAFTVTRKIKARHFIMEGRGKRYEVSRDEDAFIMFGKQGYVQVVAPGPRAGGAGAGTVRVGFDGPRDIPVTRWAPGSPKP